MRSRARCGARRCVCAKHAVVCAVVLLDGGSSWPAPSRAALLEPPAAASAAAAAFCAGSSLVPGVGRRHAAGWSISFVSSFGRAVARDRADCCGAAWHAPGRSREEHHLLAW